MPAVAGRARRSSALALAGGGYGGVALGLGAAADLARRSCCRPVRPTGRVRSIRWFARRRRWRSPALAVLTAVLARLVARRRAPASPTSSGSSAYLGASSSPGCCCAPGRPLGRSRGSAPGSSSVVGVALASRLLGPRRRATRPRRGASRRSSGRLSYPIGYWNALGAMAAMAVPLLVWLASSAAAGPALGARCSPASSPVLLAAYMTSSRGALIAAALGAGVAIAAARSRAGPLAGARSSARSPPLPAISRDRWRPGSLDSPGHGTRAARGCGLPGAALVGIAFAARRRPGGRSTARRDPGPRAADAPCRSPPALVGRWSRSSCSSGRARSPATSRPRRAARRPDRAARRSRSPGSGRAQFWATALDAFAAEPGRGIGAGGFASYWNRNGSLETPVQNAHSEPLELLAELGPLGLLAFVAFFARRRGSPASAGPAARRRRRRRRPRAARRPGWSGS